MLSVCLDYVDGVILTLYVDTSKMKLCFHSSTARTHHKSSTELFRFDSVVASLSAMYFSLESLASTKFKKYIALAAGLENGEVHVLALRYDTENPKDKFTPFPQIIKSKAVFSSLNPISFVYVDSHNTIFCDTKSNVRIGFTPVILDRLLSDVDCVTIPLYLPVRLDNTAVSLTAVVTIPFHPGSTDDECSEKYIRRQALVSFCCNADSVAKSGCDILILGCSGGQVFWMRRPSFDLSSTRQSDLSIQAKLMHTVPGAVTHIVLANLRPTDSFAGNGSDIPMQQHEHTPERTFQENSHLCILTEDIIFCFGVRVISGLLAVDSWRASLQFQPQQRHRQHQCRDFRPTSSSRDKQTESTALNYGMVDHVPLSCVQWLPALRLFLFLTSRGEFVAAISQSDVKQARGNDDEDLAAPHTNKSGRSKTGHQKSYSTTDSLRRNESSPLFGTSTSEAYVRSRSRNIIAIAREPPTHEPLHLHRVCSLSCPAISLMHVTPSGSLVLRTSKGGQLVIQQNTLLRSLDKVMTESPQSHSGPPPGSHGQHISDGYHGILALQRALVEAGWPQNRLLSSSGKSQNKPLVTIRMIEQVRESMRIAGNRYRQAKQEERALSLQLLQMAALVTALQEQGQGQDPKRLCQEYEAGTAMTGMSRSCTEHSGAMLWKQQMWTQLNLRSETSVAGRCTFMDIEVTCTDVQRMRALQGRLIFIAATFNEAAATACDTITTFQQRLCFVPKKIRDKGYLLSKQGIPPKTAGAAGGGGLPPHSSTKTSSRDAFLYRTSIPIDITKLCEVTVDITVDIPFYEPDIGFAHASCGLPPPLGLGLRQEAVCGAGLHLHQGRISLAEVARVLGSESAVQAALLRDDWRKLDPPRHVRGPNVGKESHTIHSDSLRGHGSSTGVQNTKKSIEMGTIGPKTGSDYDEHSLSLPLLSIIEMGSGANGTSPPTDLGGPVLQAISELQDNAEESAEEWRESFLLQGGQSGTEVQLRAKFCQDDRILGLDGNLCQSSSSHAPVLRVRVMKKNVEESLNVEELHLSSCWRGERDQGAPTSKPSGVEVASTRATQRTVEVLNLSSVNKTLLVAARAYATATAVRALKAAENQGIGRAYTEGQTHEANRGKTASKSVAASSHSNFSSGDVYSMPRILQKVMKDCADLVNELYREEAEIQKSCTSKNRPSSVHPVVCSTIVEAHEVHNFSVRGAISSTDTALAIASAKLWESFKTAREFGY